MHTLQRSLLALALALLSACGGGDGGSTCFVVNDTRVEIHNVWSEFIWEDDLGSSITSKKSTVTLNDERHELDWSNITRADGAVQSFDVQIDGNPHSYPADAC